MNHRTITTTVAKIPYPPWHVREDFDEEIETLRAEFEVYLSSSM